MTDAQTVLNDWQAPEDWGLVNVDIEKDFGDDGRLAVPGGNAIVPLVNLLTPAFNTKVFLRDMHPEGHGSFASSHDGADEYQKINMAYGEQTLWPDHCVQGTDGVEFIDGLDIPEDALFLSKGTNRDIDSYSGFFENDRVTQPVFEDGKTLAEVFREKGVTTIVFTGLAYDFCVGWNALDAVHEGFNAIVVEDATRSIGLPGQEDGKTTTDEMTEAMLAAGVKIVSAADLPKLAAGA